MSVQVGTVTEAKMTNKKLLGQDIASTLDKGLNLASNLVKRALNVSHSISKAAGAEPAALNKSKTHSQSKSKPQQRGI